MHPLMFLLSVFCHHFVNRKKKQVPRVGQHKYRWQYSNGRQIAIGVRTIKPVSHPHNNTKDTKLDNPPKP